MPASDQGGRDLTFRAARYREGACERVELGAAIDAARRGDVIWLDIRYDDPEAARQLLRQELGFHELLVEDAVSDRERPKLMEFDGTRFLSVPHVRTDVDELVFTDLAIFMRGNSLVTVASCQLRPVDVWFARWLEHPNRLGEHPASLVHVLLDEVVDEYFPVMENLEESVEDVSDRVFQGDSGRVGDILSLKRDLLALRRRLSPIRELLNSLLRRGSEGMPEHLLPYYQDVYDHALRLLEQTDYLRDSLGTLLDIHLANVSNRLNEVVKRMTVFSTVLVSMTLVSGIYGMNFEFMPELQWRYGYAYALGLMALVGAAVLYGFRRARWF